MSSWSRIVSVSATNLDAPALVTPARLTKLLVRYSNATVCPAVMTAGHTVAFEYLTSNFVNLAGVTSAGASRFVADTDTIRLQDDIVLQGLTWRWLKKKGFAYAEDFK